MDTRKARTAAQVVRMDMQVVRMAGKRQANGIPFDNRNLFVYVFPWKVTFLHYGSQKSWVVYYHHELNANQIW